MRTSRILKPVTWLLVLAIGHVPVPMLHDHEGLEDGQLATHIENFHRSAEQDRDLGWHLHVYCLGLNYSVPQNGWSAEHSSSDVDFIDELPQALDRESETLLRLYRRSRTGHSLYLSADLTQGWRSYDTGSRSHHVAGSLRQQSDVPLYSLHCALLI